MRSTLTSWQNIAPTTLYAHVWSQVAFAMQNNNKNHFPTWWSCCEGIKIFVDYRKVFVRVSISIFSGGLFEKVSDLSSPITPPPPSQSSSITAFRSLMVSLINFVAGWRRQTSQTRSYWIVISGYYSNYNKVDLLVFFFFSSHKKIYCQFYHAKQSHPTWRENALLRHWARWDPSFADDGSLWIQQGCKRN